MCRMLLMFTVTLRNCQKHVVVQLYSTPKELKAGEQSWQQTVIVSWKTGHVRDCLKLE